MIVIPACVLSVTPFVFDKEVGKMQKRQKELIARVEEEDKKGVNKDKRKIL